MLCNSCVGSSVSLMRRFFQTAEVFNLGFHLATVLLTALHPSSWSQSQMITASPAPFFPSHHTSGVLTKWKMGVFVLFFWSSFCLFFSFETTCLTLCPAATCHSRAGQPQAHTADLGRCPWVDSGGGRGDACGGRVTAKKAQKIIGEKKKAFGRGYYVLTDIHEACLCILCVWFLEVARG